MHVAERHVLGTSHAEIGAYLLGLWGMPNTLVEAVAHHHTPEGSGVRRFNALSALVAALALSGTDDSDAFCTPPRRNGVVGRDFFDQLEGIPFDWVDAEKVAIACLAEQHD
jgi:HD-like signal output (HDOD) protein